MALPTPAGRRARRTSERPRPPIVPDGGTTFTFVDDPLEALVMAERRPGGRDVGIMGGVATVRWYLRAGLVDELHLHVVPVLLGDGVPLFCAAEPIRRRLAVMSARAGRSATHVRYRVGAASGSTVTAPHG